MGNVVLWKPARQAELAAWYVLKMLEEAGLPPGVINLVFGDGREISTVALDHPDLAGIHFTGSTASFQEIWCTVGANVSRYRSYPRLVGETGGKDFIVAHRLADVEALATSVLRGPSSSRDRNARHHRGCMCLELRERLVAEIPHLRVGDPTDSSVFVGAVINADAYAKHRAAIDEAHADAKSEVVAGGQTTKEVSWFVHPTVVRTSDPDSRLLRDELFGPIMTSFVYPDGGLAEVLAQVDRQSPYALTGAVFANVRYAVAEADAALRHAAGNFFVNDKPTGSVVGLQPFGGSRASGTNNKATSICNLSRWVTMRTTKENLVPARDWRYPFLAPGGKPDKSR